MFIQGNHTELTQTDLLPQVSSSLTLPRDGFWISILILSV